jgi:hypothetical protein
MQETSSKPWSQQVVNMRTKIVLAIPFVCGGVLAGFLSCHRGTDEAAPNPRAHQTALGISDSELQLLLGAESVSYAKSLSEKLDIKEPVRLKDAAGYWDGGSRRLTLVDARGVEYEFMIWHGPAGPMDITRSDGKKQPQRVELAGPEERDLYGVLLRWILAHPIREALLGKADIDYPRNRVLAEASQFYFRMRRRLVPREAEIGPQAMRSSWTDGNLSVSVTKKNHETRILVRGSWRGAKAGHKLRYGVWSVNEKGDETLRYQRTRPLDVFSDEIAGFEPPRGPYRLACDYEIWDGEPAKGRLLAKNSVLSSWYQSSMDKSPHNKVLAVPGRNVDSHSIEHTGPSKSK